MPARAWPHYYFRRFGEREMWAAPDFDGVVPRALRWQPCRNLAPRDSLIRWRRPSGCRSAPQVDLLGLGFGAAAVVSIPMHAPTIMKSPFQSWIQSWIYEKSTIGRTCGAARVTKSSERGGVHFLFALAFCAFLSIARGLGQQSQHFFEHPVRPRNPEDSERALQIWPINFARGWRANPF